MLAIDRGVPGTRISRGSMFFQEPIGIDPKGGGQFPVTEHSILSAEEDALPDFLAQLAQSGGRVEAGDFEGSDEPNTGISSGGTPLHSPRYRLRTYTLYPPTPFVEPFNLMVPTPMPMDPAPLLVVFHKYGSSHNDVLQNTDFVKECAKRGWFLVCPLAGSKKHFGSLESQVNTEAVLDWMLANATLRIDRQRIYGIGFSMGGGAALNYAARHRDPAHAMFAALINHSGGVSINNTYLHDPPVRFILDFWFGDGSAGSADPWNMTRSSVIDFNSATLIVDPTTDLARNLGSTPLATWRPSVDTISYLPEQNDVLDHHLQTALGRVPGPTYSYNVVTFIGHLWRMIDASAACDWLGQFTLQVPASGRTLADHDGIYERFYLEQDAAGAFTPIDWSLDAQSNALHVGATANLKRLSIDPIAAGLTNTAPLLVTTASADATGDEIVITHWPQFPSALLRDGIATASWTYDPQTLELTLFESDGAAHTWLVTP
ncbi:MAG TPA: alpha/beta fold hydrolase [Planctomycetota bacterium]|nr:alpha/beta fold hydrolase [Planctomycetota bacterium]